MPVIELGPARVFLHATGVVQAVMIALLVLSVLCWAVILEKAVLLVRLSRDARSLEEPAATARSGTSAKAELTRAILAAGHEEAADVKPGENVAERRQRIEQAMRDAMFRSLFKAEARLPYLATIGSSAPFIGLFGTVWGIMHAFSAIGLANNTSLAVVAPGIAEALSTTALGLAAAIPASIAYNKLASDFGGLARGIGLSIARIARRADKPGSILASSA